MTAVDDDLDLSDSGPGLGEIGFERESGFTVDAAVPDDGVLPRTEGTFAGFELFSPAEEGSATSGFAGIEDVLGVVSVFLIGSVIGDFGVSAAGGIIGVDGEDGMTFGVGLGRPTIPAADSAVRVSDKSWPREFD